MNFKLTALLTATFFLSAASTFADIPNVEASGVNPIDKKTEFINNHLIAFSEVKVGNEAKKFVAVIPAIGGKKIVVYEINKATNDLTESATFTKQLHAPFYIAFDPSGMNLYGVSSTRNFVTQYTFDPASKKYVASEANKNKKLINAGFQTACDDNNFFSFDYFRTLQFFPDEHKAYITCEDKSGNLNVIGYQFNPKTGVLMIPPSSSSREGVQSAHVERTAAKDLVEVANPLAVLIGPEGRNLYSIDQKNWWHHYKLNSNGHFEPTGSRFKAEASRIESMTFGPFGKNVYVVGRDNAGESIIVHYKFDQPTGQLTKFDVVHIPRTSDQIKAHAKVHATYIQFAPSGKYAYVLDRRNNLIYQYRAEPDTGKFIALNPAAFATCSIVRSLVFDSDPTSHYAYAAASSHANLPPQNKKLCRWLMKEPYELYVDRLVMDPATGQLSNFVPRS